VELEVFSVDVGSSHGGGVRTFLVFLDLPKHVEFRTDGFPLLEEGTVVDFDLTVKDPQSTRKPRELKGPYRVKRRVLKFSSGRASKSGFSQYLEFDPVGEGGPP
jgi:hypothetical protein